MSRTFLVELAVVALAVLAGVCPLAPPLVEAWFSTGVYAAVQRTLTPASNGVPFALFDMMTLAAAAAAAVTVVRALRTARRTRRVRPAVALFGHLLSGAAVVYLVFLMLWGLNYRRVPMAERLIVEPGPPAAEAVVAFGLETASRLNALHGAAHGSGWVAPWESAALRESFSQVQRRLADAPPAEPGRLKSTLFGPYFRWASVDGMLNPFGLEVLVNPDLLPFELPFVAAHEWGHLAGFADESEASFIGWLACMHAGAPEQYSAWLALHWQVSAEMDEPDRRRLAGMLDEGPRRDIEAVVARVRRGELPWLRDAGWRVYDRYLRANRVEEGVRSYGGVVTLILRAHYADEGLPLRRGAPAGGFRDDR